jgi:hypothetical protein
MVPLPKRRWFQWSLRTLFIVVTVMGILVAWTIHDLNWIRERHSFEDAGRVVKKIDPSTLITAPGMLWLFGEKGHRDVIFYINLTGRPSDADANVRDTDLHQEMLQAKSLFPEATISVARIFSLLDPTVPDDCPGFPSPVIK